MPAMVIAEGVGPGAENVARIDPCARRVHLPGEGAVRFVVPWPLVPDQAWVLRSFRCW
jgi:hypothetical protein